MRERAVAATAAAEAAAAAAVEAAAATASKKPAARTPTPGAASAAAAAAAVAAAVVAAATLPPPPHPPSRSSIDCVVVLPACQSRLEGGVVDVLSGSEYGSAVYCPTSAACSLTVSWSCVDGPPVPVPAAPTAPTAETTVSDGVGSKGSSKPNSGKAAAATTGAPPGSKPVAFPATAPSSASATKGKAVAAPPPPAVVAVPLSQQLKLADALVRVVVTASQGMVVAAAGGDSAAYGPPAPATAADSPRASSTVAATSVMPTPPITAVSAITRPAPASPAPVVSAATTSAAALASASLIKWLQESAGKGVIPLPSPFPTASSGSGGEIVAAAGAAELGILRLCSSDGRTTSSLLSLIPSFTSRGAAGGNGNESAAVSGAAEFPTGTGGSSGSNGVETTTSAANAAARELLLAHCRGLLDGAPASCAGLISAAERGEDALVHAAAALLSGPTQSAELLVAGKRDRLTHAVHCVLRGGHLSENGAAAAATAAGGNSSASWRRTLQSRGGGGGSSSASLLSSEAVGMVEAGRTSAHLQQLAVSLEEAGRVAAAAPSAPTTTFGGGSHHRAGGRTGGRGGGGEGGGSGSSSRATAGFARTSAAGGTNSTSFDASATSTSGSAGKRATTTALPVWLSDADRSQYFQGMAAEGAFSLWSRIDSIAGRALALLPPPLPQVAAGEQQSGVEISTGCGGSDTGGNGGGTDAALEGELLSAAEGIVRGGLSVILQRAVHDAGLAYNHCVVHVEAPRRRAEGLWGEGGLNSRCEGATEQTAAVGEVSATPAVAALVASSPQIGGSDAIGAVTAAVGEAVAASPPIEGGSAASSASSSFSPRLVASPVHAAEEGAAPLPPSGSDESATPSPSLMLVAPKVTEVESAATTPTSPPQTTSFTSALQLLQQQCDAVAPELARRADIVSDIAAFGAALATLRERLTNDASTTDVAADVTHIATVSAVALVEAVGVRVAAWRGGLQGNVAACRHTVAAWLNERSAALDVLSGEIAGVIEALSSSSPSHNSSRSSSHSGTAVAFNGGSSSSQDGDDGEAMNTEMVGGRGSSGGYGVGRQRPTAWSGTISSFNKSLTALPEGSKRVIKGGEPVRFCLPEWSGSD